MKKWMNYIVVVIMLLSLCACSKKQMDWNGKTEYAHVSMNIDETNRYQYAGSVDYIFIGTVDEVKNNRISYENDNSTYSITVNENLKGNLVEKIECNKKGGYLKDGTLLLYQSDRLTDTGLPEVGKKYFFMAYAQPDGSLTLSEFWGNVAFQENTQKSEYDDYIKNQMMDQRERFVSKYDQNAK